MTQPYDPARAGDLARRAREHFKDDIAARLALYGERQRQRKERGLPVLAFCGRGRSGKDTAAAYVGGVTPLVYGGSTSRVVLPYLAWSVGVSSDEAWGARHANRRFWIEWCHAFRGRDYTLLARLNLADGDTVVGVRGDVELSRMRSEGVADLILWVHRDVPADVTVEYGPEDCDLTVLNTSSRTDFYRRLDRLLIALRLL